MALPNVACFFSTPRLATAVFLILVGTSMPASAQQSGPGLLSWAGALAPADPVAAPDDCGPRLLSWAGALAPADTDAGRGSYRGPGLSLWAGALAPADTERGPGLLSWAGASAPAEPKRPDALVPLYLSLGTLNALDVHSTRRALSRGAVESNPLMKGVAGNSGALLAVKAAGTGAMIFASEKMWKKNRVAAVVFMVATNAAMAWVVQHNYRAVQ